MPRPKQSAEEQRVSQEWQNRKAAERMQAKRDAARDIGEIPRPRHKKQRARGETDSEFFLKFFFPKVFRLPFGDPHTEYIGALDRIFADGGQQAVAMQRGGGKSSVTRGMALKAVLYGMDLTNDDIVSAYRNSRIKSHEAGQGDITVTLTVKLVPEDAGYTALVNAAVNGTNLAMLFLHKVTGKGWDCDWAVLTMSEPQPIDGVLEQTFGLAVNIDQRLATRV